MVSWVGGGPNVMTMLYPSQASAWTPAPTLGPARRTALLAQHSPCRADPASSRSAGLLSMQRPREKFKKHCSGRPGQQLRRGSTEAGAGRTPLAKRARDGPRSGQPRPIETPFFGRGLSDEHPTFYTTAGSAGREEPTGEAGRVRPRPEGLPALAGPRRGYRLMHDGCRAADRWDLCFLKLRAHMRPWTLTVGQHSPRSTRRFHHPSRAWRLQGYRSTTLRAQPC